MVPLWMGSAVFSVQAGERKGVTGLIDCPPTLANGVGGQSKRRMANMLCLLAKANKPGKRSWQSQHRNKRGAGLPTASDLTGGDHNRRSDRKNFFPYLRQEEAQQFLVSASLT